MIYCAKCRRLILVEPQYYTDGKLVCYLGKQKKLGHFQLMVKA